jgi:hypothetical protein
MSKPTAMSQALLELLFNATALPDLAQNDGSSPATTLTVALHTASPGAGGNQATNEIAYTGYARVAVNRNSGGWVVTSNSVSPAADITFGTMTAGAGGTVTHFSIGTGVGDTMICYGTVTPNISVVNTVTPKLTTATAHVET